MMTKVLWIYTALISGFMVLAYGNRSHVQVPFNNFIENPEDTLERASIGYMLHRTWVQITGQHDSQNTIDKTNLNPADLANHEFALAWLGHDTMLIRVGQKWVLTDPIFSHYATPFPPLGPKRLVQLPIEIAELPHIDVVLISHDHYDNLDLKTVRALAKQKNGSPQFLVGLGLKKWFQDNVPNSEVKEMSWWDTTSFEDTKFQFVPAQHSSGRNFSNKNKTLWGDWVVEHNTKKLYFAGDTAYEKELFKLIKHNVGDIALAALPIGAYRPRDYMRFEHMNPDEAVQAHIDLQPVSSISTHWGTFHLGDETSEEIRTDMANTITEKQINNFKLLAIGQFTEIF